MYFSFEILIKFHAVASPIFSIKSCTHRCSIFFILNIDLVSDSPSIVFRPFRPLNQQCLRPSSDTTGDTRSAPPSSLSPNITLQPERSAEEGREIASENTVILWGNEPIVSPSASKDKAQTLDGAFGLPCVEHHAMTDCRIPDPINSLFCL